MKNTSDLALLEVYASWAEELRSKYRRISMLFKHGPSIGRSRELYLAGILRRCIPDPLAVRHGAFYIPGIGASAEQDLLIVDSGKYPPIEEVGDFGVYLKGAVRACIEVKSKLTRKELLSGVKSLIHSRQIGPGWDTRYILFAYETNMSAEDLLAAIECSQDFFDHRPHLIVVLGKFVVVTTDFRPKKPRPQFNLTVFAPKQCSPDLTLMELVDEVMGLERCSPLVNLRDEIHSHFDEVASRTFVCPVERPGTGLGTNLDVRKT